MITGQIFGAANSEAPVGVLGLRQLCINFLLEKEAAKLDEEHEEEGSWPKETYDRVTQAEKNVSELVLPGVTDPITVGDCFSNNVDAWSNPLKAQMLRAEIWKLLGRVTPKANPSYYEGVLEKALQKIKQARINLDPFKKDDVLTQEAQRLKCLWKNAYPDYHIWQQHMREQRMAEQRMAEQRMAEQRMAEQRMREQHMREMLRAKKKYFYTGCAIGFGLGCFITGFPPVHCYNKDRLSIIENISEYNGYACAYNAELAHLNAKYAPLVERFFPFNKKPVKLKDYHSALSLTTESGIVSSGVLLWGVSNIFTGFCLPHGIQFLGGIPEAMVGTVQAKMDVREKVLSLLQGTAVGGLVGATTAFAGLLVYAGYKKIVGR
jgi:hypothetical protein